ncbi:peptide-methionine (R)-S-oxide reductase [Halovulum marinum]|nr:peptide-methionine (R)-S-oxide reductase [Halovulum marinum]
MPKRNGPTRRAMLQGTALAGAAAALPLTGRAQSIPKYGTTKFDYEVVRTEEEWRARLSEREYGILRAGGTELPKSDPKWSDYSAGSYHCRGCELPLYSSDWRAPLSHGWVFFYHADTDAVLTGLDRGNPYRGDAPQMGGDADLDPKRTLIEVHCRRCGSHLGHIVYLDGNLVHCINGTSLGFTGAA